MDLGIIDSPLHPTYQHPQNRITTKSEEAAQHISCVFRILRWFGIDPIIARWKIIDSVQRTLPFTRELPANSVLVLSFIITLLLIGAFLTFFLIGYFNGLNTTYLSPYDITSYNSASTSKYCHQVLTTNTGSYLATSTGQWQWNPLFQYSNATYQAIVTSLSISFDEYAYLMNLIYVAITQLGRQAAHNSLTYNLIYWMTAVFVIPGTTTQRFYLTGNPITVFNRQHTGGIITSVLGTCPSKNVSSVTSYDSNSGIIELTYNYDQYVENTRCMSAGDPTKLGYIPTISTEEFVLKFDVRSLISAISVNIGVISADELVAISGFQADVNFDDRIFHVSTYYNPKFPSMAPMVCIRGNATSVPTENADNIELSLEFSLDDDNTDGHSLFLCGLGFGDTYMIPMFNHFGANETYPVECDCSNQENLNLDFPFANCNKFNFISGVFYWNTSDPTPILELLTRYDFNYTKLNAATFQPSFIDSYWGLKSPNAKTIFQQQSYREQAYSFCNSTLYGLCSMVIFSSFDDDFQANWAINEYYYILSNGACRDSITPHYEDWLKLIDFPFAPLVESYQKCSYSRTVLFLNQAGIAMGNASLLAPVAAFFVVAVFYCFVWYCGSDHSNSPYSRVEIERANYSLGLALLVARDGQLPGDVDETGRVGNQEAVRKVMECLSHDETIANDPKVASLIKQLNAELSYLSDQRSRLQQKATVVDTSDASSLTINSPIVNNAHVV